MDHAARRAEAPRTDDFETGVSADDGLELRVWLRLLTCSTLIEHGVRQGLHRSFETTLPRFDVLAQLQRAGKPLSMGDLSRRLMVTNGNVTGLVDRLKSEGLVDRRRSDGDRRVQIVSLTQAGAASFERMAADNRRWVTGMMAGLSRQEKDALFALLGRLKSAVLDAGQTTEEANE